jgi:hypothetical protein
MRRTQRHHSGNDDSVDIERTEGGVSVKGDRVITYELDPTIRRRSLHDFISHEINPLLDDGWAVSDVKIKAPEAGLAEPCRLEVILIDAALSSHGMDASASSAPV